MAKFRPSLSNGNLVKFKDKKDSRTFKVVNCTWDVKESRKLGFYGRKLPTSDGACIVFLKARDGNIIKCRRSELWKIPDKDQPQYRCRKARTRL